MSHEHETPTAGTGSAPAEESPAALRPEARPDFLERAKRILGGDIRPEDYLPVTPEVEAHVKRDLAFAEEHIRKAHEAGRIPAVFDADATTSEPGFDVPYSVRQRNEWLLSLHYGGQNIAYIENNRGVVVLAVGLEAGGALLEAFPYQMRQDVAFGAPIPPDVITIF
jgi:hypothetical protein